MTRGRVGRFRSRTPWSLAFALAFSCACVGDRAVADACLPESAGVDTSHGNTYFSIFMGGGRGQVFEARDTVLKSVSVWREWTNNDAAALRLYVMELDSTGTPDIDRILLYGPTLQIEFGDGVHPI